MKKKYERKCVSKERYHETVGNALGARRSALRQQFSKFNANKSIYLYAYS